MDVRDRPALRRLFAGHRFDAVIHFAGLKAVGDSVAMPLAYDDNNVSGSGALLECMAEVGLRTIVVLIIADAVRRARVRADPGPPLDLSSAARNDAVGGGL